MLTAVFGVLTILIALLASLLHGKGFHASCGPPFPVLLVLFVSVFALAHTTFMLWSDSNSNPALILKHSPRGENNSGVVVLSNMILGVCAGPLLGICLLGMLTERVNSTGG